MMIGVTGLKHTVILQAKITKTRSPPRVSGIDCTSHESRVQYTTIQYYWELKIGGSHLQKAVADPPKKPPRVSRSQARSSGELITCRHSVGTTSNWLPKTIPHCSSEFCCPHHLYNPSPLGALPRESVGLYPSATTTELGLHLAVTNIIHIFAFYGVSWQAKCFLRALSQSSLEGEVTDSAVPAEGQIHFETTTRV